MTWPPPKNLARVSSPYQRCRCLPGPSWLFELAGLALGFAGSSPPPRIPVARSVAGLLATAFNPVNAEILLPRGRGFIVKLGRAPPSSTATRAKAMSGANSGKTRGCLWTYGMSVLGTQWATTHERCSLAGVGARSLPRDLPIQKAGSIVAAFPSLVEIPGLLPKGVLLRSVISERSSGIRLGDAGSLEPTIEHQQGRHACRSIASMFSG